jgi:hypothetical protein
MTQLCAYDYCFVAYLQGLSWANVRLFLTAAAAEALSAQPQQLHTEQTKFGVGTENHAFEVVPDGDVIQQKVPPTLCLRLLLHGLPAGPVLDELWAVSDSSSAEALPAQPQQLH